MKNLVVNQSAVEFLRDLIQQGMVNTNRDNWTEDQPSAEDGKQYLNDHTFEEYGNWFLAVNEDANPDAKERYEFPVGNFREVFRSGVIAAEHRAGQYGHSDVEAAAKDLLNLINKK